MTTYNVSNLDSNASVVTVTSQGPQGADAVLQAGNRGDFTVAIAGNGSQTATINTGAVTSDKILDGTILNADINASAGIAFSKLATGALPTAITVTTGNITDNSITSLKIVDNSITSSKIADGSIVNADINASASILGTKISPNFGNQTISGGQGQFSTNTNNQILLIDGDSGDSLTDARVALGFRNGSEGSLGKIGPFLDNSNIYIQNDVNDGFVGIRTKSGDNITQRFTVNTTGAEINGNLVVTGLVDSVDIAARDTLFGGLTSSSGVLTDGVTATTQSAGDNSAKVATTAYTDTAISNLVDSSPAALNTLNELAAALGDDANFSTTVTNSIATKLSLSGGTLTGNVSLDGNKSTTYNPDATGGGLVINHSGSIANFRNLTGQTRISCANGEIIRLQSNDGLKIFAAFGGATDANTNNDSHVDLFFNNGRKATTVADGLQIIGILRAGNIGDLPTLDSTTRAVLHGALDDTNSSQNSTSGISIFCKGNGNSRINFGNNETEERSQIRYGNTNNRLDFSVRDITNSTIANQTLNTQLRINSDSVELNYDGTKKAETSATGFDVLGQLLIQDTAPRVDFVETDHNNRYRLSASSGTLQLQISTDDGSSYTGAIGIIGSGNIVIPDGDSVNFGLEDDLVIVHDGSDSKITNKTGNLKIQGDAINLSNQAGDEFYLTATANDAISLYFNGTEKAKTSSTGFEVLDRLLIKSTSPGIDFEDNGHTTKYRWNAGNGILQLQISVNNGPFNNSIGIGGVGNIFIPDGDKVNFGTGNDLTIVHDGSNAKITNKTGNLIIESNTNQTGIQVIRNGAIELHHSGTKKAETTTTGFNVIGTSIKLKDPDTSTNNQDLVKIFHGGTGGNTLIAGQIGDIKIQPNEDGGQVKLFETTKDQTTNENITTQRLMTTNSGITVNGTVTESSDIALKENIQPLSNALDKVKQLTGYKFNFKNTTNKTIGVIAQDVEKVFPELVHGEEGEKSLQYSGLIGALIESIKELSAKVAALENQ